MEDTENLRYPDLYPPSAPPLDGSDQSINNLNRLFKTSYVRVPSKCSICSENIQLKSHAFVTPKCGHPYHYKCGYEWLKKHPDNCMECPNSTEKSDSPLGVHVEKEPKIPKKEMEAIQNQEEFSGGLPKHSGSKYDFSDGIPIDHGDDPEFTAELERRFGHLSEKREKAFVKQRLSVIQKLKLLGLNSVATKDKRKQDITMDMLRNNDITIKELLCYNVDWSTMHTDLGIKTWEDFISLRPTIRDIAQIGVGRMMQVYGMTYDRLKRDLKITFDNLIDLHPTALNMIGMDVSFDTLIGEMLNLEDMYNLDYTPTEWVMLGMKTEDLFKMNMNMQVFEYLQWDIVEVLKQFKIDQAQKKTLGIDNLLSQAVRRKPKRY